MAAWYHESGGRSSQTHQQGARSELSRTYRNGSGKCHVLFLLQTTLPLVYAVDVREKGCIFFEYVKNGLPLDKEEMPGKEEKEIVLKLKKPH